MKKEYALLEVSVIRFENEDIVTSSGVKSITSYLGRGDNDIAFDLFNNQN